MFSRFLALFNGGMRAYKIQDVKRQARIGVTAKSLKELVEKGCEKLKIPLDDVHVVIEDDGTLVDSETFFKKLPAQTVFVFLRDGQIWRGAGAMIHEALSKLSNVTHRAEIASQIRDLMGDENSPEKIHIMSQYLDMLETDPATEFRYENEDWFEGLNKKYKSKSEWMRNSAQTRIRSYYISAKEQIEKESDAKTKELLLDLLEELYEQLKSKDFHAGYFDRTARSSDRICDPKGWFKCEGAFDMKQCDKQHTINPYASLGYRQLFGLWNLDHIIEKSREVIPTLIEAAKKKPKNLELDWSNVYKLLFTRKNLKLVQVSCHKKAARSSANCNISDFYTES
ncbi:DNA fragmentation factor subunit beta-like [Gigantopelta aegis]|uniref:DNA fragmentation factor subunit beta-like n=1 Tax=Gigantopelta aegis TaxID=1735272 RepID=UPI001B889623|nr:DNA fragmentation factor subunit beta-like [Gigantopelta aegis]